MDDDEYVESLEKRVGGVGVEDGLDDILKGITAGRKRKSKVSNVNQIIETPVKKSVIIPHVVKDVVKEIVCDDDDTKEVVRKCTRQVQGLLNRLSEANTSTIVAEIHGLYNNYPRGVLNSVIIDRIAFAVYNQYVLVDTFVIVHAAVIACLYRLVGTDLAAAFVQHCTEKFLAFYVDGMKKECLDMATMIAELYYFKVISSNLLYGLVRQCLESLNELDIELLLRFIKNSWDQLRVDDPTASSEIVNEILKRVNKAELSSRGQFLVDCVAELKSNRYRGKRSIMAVECLQRMKKIISSTSTLHLPTPLQVSLDDITQAESKGRWWLVGATWNDGGMPGVVKKKGDTLYDLATEQRMNTEVRKSIFVAVMSAEDYVDAKNKIIKQGLTKAQQRDIYIVLLHCCLSEKCYNPYYALVANALCVKNSQRMALQVAIWNVIDNKKKMKSVTRCINLAKFSTALICKNCLQFDMIKVMDMDNLTSNESLFLQVLFLELIKECRLEGDEYFQQLGSINGSTLKGILAFMENTLVSSNLIPETGNFHSQIEHYTSVVKQLALE